MNPTSGPEQATSEAEVEAIGPSRLERRYRTVLRMLPRWYRDDRAEEMTATFLAERTDRVDLEYSWPGWAETGAVAALAVRTRLAGDRGPARALAWGKAVRLAGLLGLLAWAAEGVGWNLGTTAAELSRGASFPEALLGSDLFLPAWRSVAALVLAALAVGAFATLLSGRRRTAVALAVTTAAGYFAARIADLTAGGDPWALTRTDVPLMLGVPAACLALGYHREAPPVTHARRWLALFAGLALSSFASYYAMAASTVILPIDLQTWALLFGTLAVLMVPRFAAIRQSAGWLAALAICCTLKALFYTQATYYTFKYPSDLDAERAGAMATVAMMVALACTAVAAWIAAARAMRSLETPSLAH